MSEATQRCLTGDCPVTGHRRHAPRTNEALAEDMGRTMSDHHGSELILPGVCCVGEW